MASKKSSSNRKRSRSSDQKKIKKNHNLYFLLAFIIIIIIVVASILLLNNNDEKSSDKKNPIAVFDTTLGTFKIELYQEKMPNTCENFIKLVNDGFYDGMNFYRVSDDFMIQAGRYFPDGSEDSSQYRTIMFEESDVKHLDGAISMARGQSMDSASAEFFICDGAQSLLDGQYAAFGNTIEGLDIVHEIAGRPHDNSHPAGGGKPNKDIIITQIIIE